MENHLENDVTFLQVSILGSQACAGHLFDEDLTPQTETIFYPTTQTHRTLLPQSSPKETDETLTGAPKRNINAACQNLFISATGTE